MKKKITIALEERLLHRIDREVELGNEKNRSSAIESHLMKFYGDFTDTSVIIFAYDYKWDNREYPFSVPKSLLSIRLKPLISRQIEMFLSVGITDFHILIPEGEEKIFETHLRLSFPHIKFHFYPIKSSLLSGAALEKVMFKKDLLGEKVFILNGDVFFGNLDIKKYFDFHQKKGSDFSFCLKFVMTPEQLGNVIIQGDTVIDFVEKPKAKASFLTNSGLYLTSKEFLDSNDFGEYLERDFFPNICKQYNVGGFLYSGEWEHIQNDSTFERVNGDLM